MKTIIFSLLVPLALLAQQPAPVKVPDAENLKLKDAKIALVNIESEMARLQARFSELFQQHVAAQAAFDQAVVDARKAANCPTCAVNEKAELVKPPETPKPAEKK